MENSDVVLANRTRRSHATKVAKEVLELYKYITEMTNSIPGCC